MAAAYEPAVESFSGGRDHSPCLSKGEIARTGLVRHRACDARIAGSADYNGCLQDTHRAWPHQLTIGERLQKYAEPLPSKQPGVTANPAFHSLLGTATGLALGLGAVTVTDEHVLLALAYGHYARVPSHLASYGIDSDAIVEMLMRRGTRVPPQLPPETLLSPNRLGARVYLSIK